MKLTVGTKTDVGRHREANEDSFLVQTPLFGVADGMGGHAAGDVASATAVEVVSHGAQDGGELDPEALAKLIRDANAEIWKKALADRELQGMGTTCTLVLIDDRRAHLAHVGDSRAYRFRAGDLKQLSEDHTLVARMAREGRIAPEEAQHHPQRNVITRALGIDEDVEVDLMPFEVEPGDRIMLCSDGLTSMLEDPDIRNRLAEITDPQAAAEALVDAANEAGGTDNITVVIIDIAEGEGVTDLSTDSRTPAPPMNTVASDTPRSNRQAAAPVGSPTPAPRPDDPSLTGVHRTQDLSDPDDSPPPERRGGRLVAWLVALALLAGLGYVAARMTLSNSWYVGANESGNVTIYQGIPEEIGGLDLSDPVQESTIAVEDLPEFLRQDVARGIKRDSRAEAEATLTDLRERADDFKRENTRDRTGG